MTVLLPPFCFPQNATAIVGRWTLCAPGNLTTVGAEILAANLGDHA
jgi:hypothetical protein